MGIGATAKNYKVVYTSRREVYEVLQLASRCMILFLALFFLRW
jgi:hypothetical protein